MINPTDNALAIVATLISVVLGGLAGIALARRPGVWTKAFLALVFLILVTPEIVDAIGLQIWFVNLGGIFRRGLFPLWFGQSIFSSAVVTLIVRAGTSSIRSPARRSPVYPDATRCTRLSTSDSELASDSDSGVDTLPLMLIR